MNTILFSVNFLDREMFFDKVIANITESGKRSADEWVATVD